MKRAWARWVALLDTREPANTLAVMRMITAATVFITLFNAWSSGAARALWADDGIGPFAPGLFRYIGGAGWPQVRAVLMVALVASALLGLGAFTRGAAVATWLSFRALAGLNIWSGGAGDDVLSNALFLLMLSQSGRAWSLDARWFHGENIVPAWPRYLAIGQLVTIYFSTGTNKFSASWLPGGRLDAVWYVLQHPIYQRRPLPWFPPALAQAATLTTWIFEVSSPLLLLAFYYRATLARPGRLRAWFNRWDYRLWYLGVGFCLHLGIELTMEVGAFFGAMLAFYAACIHPLEWPKRRSSAAKTPSTLA